VTRRDSPWRLRYDLMSARLLLAVSQAEARGELRPEVHRFLADRYAQLARHWRQRGWRAHAAALGSKAEWHADRSGHDDPPPAIAVGLPRPRSHAVVDARGRVLAGRWTPPRIPDCLRLTR
jgi:hypothetical protein